MNGGRYWITVMMALTAASALSEAGARQERTIVLDAVRIVDGTGAPPIPRGRIVIEGERVTAIGAASEVAIPAGVRPIDLSGQTVTPGLIDSHFHIEDDPRLALRQLSHGVTSFRDPGQWNDKFVELRQMIAADRLPGPRIFTAGPHIDGQDPAYPHDAVVARDADEARLLAERNIAEGATALKIYFRLPLASVRAVTAVCDARRVPCTSHNEVLDARDLLEAGVHGFEHVTSLGVSLMPRRRAEAYRQSVLASNDARREGRYRSFAAVDLDGPEARALWAAIGKHRPWLDATLAVFERRADQPPKGTKPQMATILEAGFEKMQQVSRRAASEGARLVLGGHSVVPFAGRGEAPWRELELLVASGLSPLEAVNAATGTAAAFLYRSDDLGTLAPGRLADLVVYRDDPSRDIAAIRTVDRVMVGGQWVDIARYRGF